MLMDNVKKFLFSQYFDAADWGSLFYSCLLMPREECIEQKNFQLLSEMENRYQRNRCEISTQKTENRQHIDNTSW